jgi:hypothetical protein
MDYKDEMRKLIDIIKQQSFTAPLAQTLDDLNSLTTATSELSDRINIRVSKSLQPKDKQASKSVKTKGVKKPKPFPSVTPPSIPQSKNTPQQKADKLSTIQATDFNKKRDDFVQKQQSIKPIKPLSSV